MNEVDYLIEQLESNIYELNEQIRTCLNMVTAAYLQGKKDAYSYVLCALEGGRDAGYLDTETLS